LISFSFVNKMFKYHFDRYISVLEISNHNINVLSGMPRGINKDPQDLGRFYIDYTEYIDLEGVVVNNRIELDVFKQKILPFLIEGLQHLQRKQPQVFKIYITGKLQRVDNFEQLTKLISSKIINKSFLGIEAVPWDKESYYAFTSFFDTTKMVKWEIRRISGGTKRSHLYYFTRQGLHFYINYNNILMTFTNGEDFSQTKAIPAGIHQFIESILKTESLSIELIQNYINSLKQSIAFEIEKNMEFYKIQAVDYIIISGIKPIISGTKIINDKGSYSIQYRNIDFKKRIFSSREMMLFINKIKESNTKSNQNAFNTWMYDFFVIIFKSVLSNKGKSHFGVNFNKSNAQIGYYYSLYKELKKA